MNISKNFGKPNERRIKGLSVNTLIPNILTLMALAAGLTSMRLAIQERWEFAVFAVVIAAILSINELKDIEEPKLQDYNMSNAAKKSLRFIFQGVFLIILLVSLGLISFYIIFA